ncbi:extracellular solute-binding protein [Paenibacillus sp. 1P07SE]|uniref:extracellular solute-binding protein n=1 Tax=Paenibacillus sp. 1P07SE TaxID=3132209 RepID=UPI0039A58340
MSRKWSIIAASILTVSMVAGCSGNNGNNPPANNVETNNGADNEAPPAELSMMVQSHAAWPLQEDWLVYELLEDYANVELEVSGYQGNWWEAIPLIIASGDMPDLMWMSGPDIIHENGGNGALVDLLEHMDKMPNLQAFIDDHPEETNSLLSHDGKLYMHPAHGAFGDWDGLWLHREDIFKKHNIATPATYDELYDVLVQLKELYPDSYPLYIADWGAMNQIALSFGTNNSYYYNEEAGEWRFGPSEESYREALQFLADAYQAKLIPQEFGNLDNNKRNELVTTDKTFILFGYINNIDTYNNLAREANPDFKMAQFTPPGGAGHEGIHGEKFIFQQGLTVTTTSKNKDAAFAFIDSLFTEEAREMLSWGKEGVTYEKVDGKNQYLPEITDTAVRSIEYGLRTAGVSAWFDNEANVSLFNEETKASYDEASKHIGPAPEVAVFSKEEREAISIKREAIDKYTSENVSKFIIGQRPLTEWDAYVEGLHNLGMNDVLQVFEEAYARSE